MADPAARVAAAGGQGRPGQQQDQPGVGKKLMGIVRMAMFWYFATRFFGGSKRPAEPSIMMSNIFHKGEPLDMWLYLSEKEVFNDFGNEHALVWHETNVPYAVWGPASSRSLSLKYHPSEDLKHNGSLYAHVFFARSGYPPDPSDPEYEPLSTFRRTHSVVTFLPKSKADKRKSLLGDSKQPEEEPLNELRNDSHDEVKNEGPVEWVSYWKPNITINLVDDFTRYAHNNIPPHIAGCIQNFVLDSAI